MVSLRFVARFGVALAWWFAGLGVALPAQPAETTPPPVNATEPLAAYYEEATVETARTSIYIGNVTLAMTPFQRDGDTYASTYTAKVVPFFFYNEAGSISIQLSDDDLHRLAAGERVYFQGDAQTDDGKPRRVEGHADPADARSGKIKVRVWVTKKIELIFNTTYTFTGPESAPSE